MTADFIEQHTIADATEAANDAAVTWREETLTAFNAKGVTFVRFSHPPGESSRLYIEGWRERPAEQGPHPWETGQ